MEKLNRQQIRKMNRDYCNNKWYVKDWQTMKFIRTDNDAIGTGTFEVYANHQYTCIKRDNKPLITWLSIKRNDKAEIHNWQHMQQIKNDICGNEREAIEIYPPMSRIVDAANQYHLWVLPLGETVGIGFKKRLVNIQTQNK